MYLYVIIIIDMKNIVTILLVLLTVFASAQTDLESIMTLEINELRANPKSFIPHIEEYISFNNEMIGRIKSGKTKISSSKLNGEAVIIDRIKAAKELIEILNTIEPLDTLVFNVDMYIITKKHAEYLDANNKMSHKDSNGNSASTRFKEINLDVSENLVSVGSFIKDTTTPLLLTLLIDAGIDNRGHRKNILANDIRFVSVSIVGGVCVQNFAH